MNMTEVSPNKAESIELIINEIKLGWHRETFAPIRIIFVWGIFNSPTLINVYEKNLDKRLVRI
jgi:hypothetical protein